MSLNPVSSSEKESMNLTEERLQISILRQGRNDGSVVPLGRGVKYTRGWILQGGWNGGMDLWIKPGGVSYSGKAVSLSPGKVLVLVHCR